MSERRQPVLFISHVPGDQAEVDRLRAALASVGITAVSGRAAAFAGDVVAQMGGCVVYLTRAAAESEVVRGEIASAARARMKRPEYAVIAVVRGVDGDTVARLFQGVSIVRIGLASAEPIEDVTTEIATAVLAEDAHFSGERGTGGFESFNEPDVHIPGVGVVRDPADIGTPVTFSVDDGDDRIRAEPPGVGPDRGMEPDDVPVEPRETGTFLNAWFPDVPAGAGAPPRLAVGVAARLFVNLGPRRVPNAAVSAALGKEAETRIAQESYVDVVVLCPGATVSPLRQRLGLPPSAANVLSFRLAPEVTGPLTATVLLLIQNEPVHRSEIALVAFDPGELGAFVPAAGAGGGEP